MTGALFVICFGLILWAIRQEVRITAIENDKAVQAKRVDLIEQCFLDIAAIEPPPQTKPRSRR